VTARSVPDVATLLAVRPLGDDRFEAPAGRPPDDPMGGLFGGRPLSIGLRAAGTTVAPDRLPHSVHGYFLRAGDDRLPLEIQVDRDRDGRSFSSRRVVISQQGTTIFTMSASFHLPEAGPDEQVPTMPDDVPEPESLAPSAIGGPARVLVDIRNAGSVHGTTEPSRAWGRARGPLPEDPLVHSCVLINFSDVYTGLPALPGTENHGGPSLDHAFWFHRPARLDDWVLMDLRPVSTGRGRGLYVGSFFDRRGVLVASVAQEVLFSTDRPIPVRPPGMEP
jgi:acyl-CoA thioesterase-2